MKNETAIAIQTNRGDPKMKNKILVIEDGRAISELLCMNLTIAGYETIAAYDGIEA